MDWDKWWADHLARKKDSAGAINEFWKRFIGAFLILKAARDDEGEDYTNPELVEAWGVHGTYATFELDRANDALKVTYGIQRPVMYGRFFEIQIRVRDSLCEMGGFAVTGAKTPEAAAAVVLNRLQIVSEGAFKTAEIVGENG